MIWITLLIFLPVLLYIYNKIKQSIKTMKKNTLYNDADNMIYVKSQNNNILIICTDMDQVDAVQKKMHKHGNLMVDFEEWDEDEDTKYIVTFKVRDGQKPVYN